MSGHYRTNDAPVEIGTIETNDDFIRRMQIVADEKKAEIENNGISVIVEEIKKSIEKSAKYGIRKDLIWIKDRFLPSKPKSEIEAEIRGKLGSLVECKFQWDENGASSSLIYEF